MFDVDVEKLTAVLPPWKLTVTVKGVSYAVRQPTLAEDEKLDHAKAMKDGDLIHLMWNLFEGKAPPKSDANRDTLIMLYTQLLLYRKTRSRLHIAVVEAAMLQLSKTLTAKLPERFAGMN